MSGAKDKALASNVRLNSSDSSSHPHASNYTNVSAAQGIAYVDFGFVEPSMLGVIANPARKGEAAPKSIEGQIVTRVAVGVDLLARLHQQIQHIIVGLRASQAKQKS